jgi:thioredoxin-related protein
MRTVVVALFFLLGASMFAAPEYPRMGPDIFDPQGKGETLIDAAVTQARQDKKRVLVLFGTNWCPWCRQLHQVLGSEPRIIGRLRQRFVLVYVDANTRNDKARNRSVNERFGNPLRYGIPVFVVLDAEGNLLTTRETQSLADATDKGVADKLLMFLAEW